MYPQGRPVRPWSHLNFQIPTIGAGAPKFSLWLRPCNIYHINWSNLLFRVGFWSEFLKKFLFWNHVLITLNNWRIPLPSAKCRPEKLKRNKITNIRALHQLVACIWCSSTLLVRILQTATEFSKNSSKILTGISFFVLRDHLKPKLWNT